MDAFVPYRAISALAGSGKTHQLTSRFIALLALGRDPARILAITFTRKAAGEIFDRIVRRLAAAATLEPARRELEAALREQLGDPAFAVSHDKARGWLEVLLEAMPRLRIGTIDSLFASVVKAFALELGLPPRQEMLDGVALDHAREEALTRACEDIGDDQTARAAFLEAFKLATSEEERSVRETILAAVREGHEVFLDLPDADAWGVAGRLWPGRAWWNPSGFPSHEALAGRTERFARRYLDADGLDKRYIKGWEKLLDRVRACDWDGVLETPLAGKLLAVREELAHGKAEIEYYAKPFRLNQENADDAWHFIAAATRGAIARTLQETQGKHRLLAAYEHACQAELRGRGRLTFADVPLLLGRMCASEVQLDIDYRLDSRIDHWLLDEFQDTNARQWRVIGRLADEVLQSTEADRSFFYVGDVKQAIYAWRGGEATLFEAVRAYYGARFGAPKVLDTSWRSSPVVLDAVNRAFGQLKEVRCIADAYPQVAGNWAARWQAHRAAPRNEALPGRVELHEVARDGEGDGDPPRIALTCGVVADLLARGVRTIGILVRLNSYGDRVADALRRRGLQVRRESNPRLLDNGVVSALLSMLALADHPDDGLAGPHLALTPLRGVLARWLARAGRVPAEGFLFIELATHLREAAARLGVAGLLAEIIDLCREEGLLRDEFIGMRVRQLLDAAADFDREGEGSPGEFVRQAAGLQVNDPGLDSRVVVMTTHKAKGLEYDAVILPDLQGSERQWTHVRRSDLKVGRSGAPAAAGRVNPAEEEDRGDQWVFPFPKDALAGADPVLEAFAARITEGRVAEELCLLYVAMTRARQGLYLVVDEPGKTSDALYASTFLGEALAQGRPDPTETCAGIPSRLLYAQGDAAWPAAGAPRKEAGAEGAADAIMTRPFHLPSGAAGAAPRRLLYRTPSGEERVPEFRPAPALFAMGKASAAERGVILHDLFSRIEWLEPGAGEAALRGYARDCGPCPAGIRDEFLRALAAPDLSLALRRPAVRTEVWREQAFELAEDNTWISGRVDRVVVERDEGGRPVSAEVIDFKSDRVADERGLAELQERYAPQIRWYVRVLTRLLNLPAEKIRARLLLTHSGQVLELPGET